ncbi:VWA domain-containing protein [Azospirillum sp. TSO5]|uniref:nitric oxide reductase activation protein NorD n=1 Tax=Azospirillum sp. TSO5 TaxID=716760 RepID=UPI000D649233|nr:VWA domain-containing protein [Azospirillum sp. TSO5]
MPDDQSRQFPADQFPADTAFSSVERRLVAYLVALWRLRVPIRHAKPDRAGNPPRRVSISDGLIWMPGTFRGVDGRRSGALFRAALVHAGAHLRFTGPRFPAAGLKPMQLALVSLIEDARVEHLAMREHPGLLRVWRPFHVAEPNGAGTAPALMARLARALIDPDYRDDDAWVAKGKRLFFAAESEWDSPALSRRIGGLLGNDLGQMRVQFNSKDYVVEPAYRDDNLGLWDHGEVPPTPPSDAETVFEAFRTEQEERDHGRPDDQVGEGATPARLSATDVPARAVGEEEITAPPLRYPEWDYRVGIDRPDWVVLNERRTETGDPAAIARIVERHQATADRLTALVRSAKVSRPVRLRRQPEGDRMDLDACIDAMVSHRRGEAPDPRVHEVLVRRNRDLSVLLLLDVSASTDDPIAGGGRSVLSVEREAATLFAQALDELGDPFAIHAFRSNGRQDVSYYRIKAFRQPYDAAAKGRLAGLRAGLSTRLGTALRHAGRLLEQQSTHRRLLLVVTDGEPSDIDVADRRYLLDDARRAVLGLASRGIDCFVIGLDPQGRDYLTRMFGARNVMVIDRAEKLPEVLPTFYLRLST